MTKGNVINVVKLIADLQKLQRCIGLNCKKEEVLLLKRQEKVTKIIRKHFLGTTKPSSKYQKLLQKERDKIAKSVERKNLMKCQLQKCKKISLEIMKKQVKNFMKEFKNVKNSPYYNLAYKYDKLIKDDKITDVVLMQFKDNIIRLNKKMN